MEVAPAKAGGPVLFLADMGSRFRGNDELKIP